MTESPSPEATSEPTEATTTSVRTDILAGVALTVEEVEPGVFHVVNDGVRDPSSTDNVGIAVGHDGAVWLLRQPEFLRLGADAATAWPDDKSSGWRPARRSGCAEGGCRASR